MTNSAIYIYMYIYIYIHTHIHTHSILCPPCDFSVAICAETRKGRQEFRAKHNSDRTADTSLGMKETSWEQPERKDSHFTFTKCQQHKSEYLCSHSACVTPPESHSCLLWSLGALGGGGTEGTACLFCTMSGASLGWTPGYRLDHWDCLASFCMQTQDLSGVST